MRHVLLFLYLLSVFGYSINTANAADIATHPAGTHIQSGKVIQHAISSGINYVQIDTGKQIVWVAAPAGAVVETGEQVTFSSHMPMKDFHSKSLNRDFRIIYFIKQFITPAASERGTTTPATSHDRFFPTLDKSSILPVESGKTSMQTTSRAVDIGDRLPATVLNGLNGKDRSTIDYHGKPLLINVWASWCGPCRAEMGSLERLARRYNGQQFHVIGISTDDVASDASDFLKQAVVSFDNYIDHDLQLEHMLGATSIPLTILISADGRILQKILGSREWDSPDIVEAIEKVFQIQLS